VSDTPPDDDLPTEESINGSPEDDPNAVRGSFTRVHPREFFEDEEWERRTRASQAAAPKPDLEGMSTTWKPPPRPADETGQVNIEPHEDMDAWAADWIGPVVDGTVTTGRAGPHRDTLDECLAWALRETKPARITIYLVAGEGGDH
jgi:hypothetical protein